MAHILDDLMMLSSSKLLGFLAIPTQGNNERIGRASCER